MSQVITDISKPARSQEAGWRYASSLLSTAGRLYSDLPVLQSTKKTIRFLANGMLHKTELERLRSVFDCNELSEVLNVFPAIEDKLFKSYLHAGWDLQTRLENIEDHFHEVKTLFGYQAKEIYKPEGFQLFEFADNDDEPYTLELFAGYLREGSMGVRLCNSRGDEMYALSFHLSAGPQRAMYIGAVQGPNDRIPDRQKEIVKLTRSNYGLRPKALMVETVYILAKRFGIDEIYAISNDQRIYPTVFMRGVDRSRLHFDADQLWDEYQAQLQSSGFYKFPSEPVRKDIAQLKSKKRGLYRKRYDWLDKASYHTNKSLNELMNDRVVSTTADPIQLDKAA